MSTPIDVRRLIRIATFLFSVLAASLVYFAFAQHVEEATQRLEDAQTQLRSDETAFSEIPRLRSEHSRLALRYARLFAQNPEAVFLRGLTTDARRHDVELVSSAEMHENEPPPGNATGTSQSGGAYERTALNLEFRGSYRNLLATIADLSRSEEIVRVERPTLQRDGADISAGVPVTIFEPSARASQIPPITQ